MKKKNMRIDEMKKLYFLLVFMGLIILAACQNEKLAKTEFDEPVISDNMINPYMSKAVYFSSFADLEAGMKASNINAYLLKPLNIVNHSLNNFSILDPSATSKIIVENYYVYDSELGSIKEDLDVKYISFEIKAYFYETLENKETYFEIKRNSDNMGNYANIILSNTNKAIGTIYFIENGISLSEEVINSYLNNNLIYF